MSLDNLSTTQTVTAPNTQTIISPAVPGTGRLPGTSLTGKGRDGEEVSSTGGGLGDQGREGRATGWLVTAVWTQSGSRPPVSERLTGQMDSQTSMLTTEESG